MNNDCWYKEVCTKETCEDCLRYTEMSFLIQSSGLLAAQLSNLSLEAGVDYEAFCKLADIKDSIEDFVKQGKSLYLTSRITGNGKTTWAVKLLLKYFDRIWAGNGLRVRGLFISVPAFLLQLKNFNNAVSADYLKNVDECDLVVFDDIGSTELTNYDHTQLLAHVDTRVLNNKACIFTGNIDTVGELQQRLGNRLASRIWNRSEVVKLVGKDRR